jgi:hypothetical protein
VTPERMFSFFTNIWTKKRNRLSAANACQLAYVYSNLKFSDRVANDKAAARRGVKRSICGVTVVRLMMCIVHELHVNK